MTESRPNILIVDDDPVVLSLLHGVLSDEYDVHAVTSGEDALDFLKGQDIDLVLLDILMPGINGVEVCRAIRGDDDINDLPVILITALDDALNEERGFEAGASDYISKPIRPGAVMSRVRLHMQNHLYTQFLESLLEEKDTTIEKLRLETRALLDLTGTDQQS